MNTRGHRRRNGGESSVEFALVAGVLLTVCLGVMDLGILLWTQSAIEYAAAQTARCLAVGATDCANPQQYAVNKAASQAFANVITTANVTLAYNKVAYANCSESGGTGTAGKYTVVTITANHWAGSVLPRPLSGKTMRVTACYPTTT